MIFDFPNVSNTLFKILHIYKIKGENFEAKYYLKLLLIIRVIFRADLSRSKIK